MITQEHYRNVLTSLWWSTRECGKYDNVSNRELQSWLPYLSTDQLVQIRRQAVADGHMLLAMPGLLVKGAIHVLHLFATGDDFSLNFRYAYSARLRVGYTYPWQARLRAACTGNNVRFAEQAMTYAESNWGEQTVWDAFHDVMVGTFVTRVQQHTHVYAVGLNRPMPAILADTSEPLVELLDDAIVPTDAGSVAVTPLGVAELVGDRLPWSAQHCGRCGGVPASQPFGGCLDCQLPLQTSPTDHCLALPRHVAEKLATQEIWNFDISPSVSRLRQHRTWLELQSAGGQDVAAVPQAYDRPLRSVDLN